MKKLLWTSGMALAAVVCLTACDDTSSSSYEIPTYKSDTSLPDTCSMEVAKVDTAYFACFENKWVEVTDSATVEQLKEGLDEEEIKAKLEELESLLVKPANNTPKPTSSSAQGEVEGSGDEGDSSSSSEEDEPSSSSKKKKDKDDSGEGGSGSGEGGESTPKRNAQFSVIDDYVTWSKDGTTATLNSDIDLTTLQTIFTKANNYQNLDIASKEALTTATKALERWGSPLKAEIGDFLTSKRVSEKLDSNFYILIINGLKKGDIVYTDIAPTGLCGTSSTYAKRTQFCTNETIYPLCSGKTYAPKEQFCDTRGTGTIYKYVTIGSGKKQQTWMAENLNYEYKVEGKTYGNVCYKDSDCKTYGRFYTYSAAMDSAKTKCGNLGCDVEGTVQGICPDGWHLPSIDEWNLLVESADEDAGLKLVAKSDGGSDEFGFGVRLAGEIYWYTTSGKKELKYYLNGEIGFFWSKDYIASAGDHDGWSQGEADAHYVYFSVDDEGYIGVTTDDGITISDMLNIRCVKNAE